MVLPPIIAPRSRQTVSQEESTSSFQKHSPLCGPFPSPDPTAQLHQRTRALGARTTAMQPCVVLAVLALALALTAAEASRVLEDGEQPFLTAAQFAPRSLHSCTPAVLADTASYSEAQQRVWMPRLRVPIERP